MTQNVRFGLMAIAFLSLIWVLTQISQIKDENLKQEARLIKLQTDAAHYATLKKRWEKQGSKEILLKRLATVKSFDKRFTKGDHEVIVYSGLSPKLLDKISYIILASDVLLVDFSTEKVGHSVSLKVEMK